MLEEILMEPEVRTMNITALFDYIKESAGEDTINNILEKIQIDRFRIKNKVTGEYEKLTKQHLTTDSDYFISNELSIQIFDAAKDILPGESPIFEAGRYAVRRFPQIKKRIAWVNLVSPNYLFNKASQENAKYNRTKKVAIESKPGEVTLTVEYLNGITTHNGKFLTKEICDWNKGLYHGYIELTGATEININETECITEGMPKCVFVANWKNPSIGKRIKNFIVQKWFPDVVENYQKTIEERDISVLNLEQKVKERTAELSTAYETLKNTQGLLVNSEKRAAVYHLVAGVRHEMNTHIQTFLASIQNLKHGDFDYVKQILEITGSMADSLKKDDIEEAKTYLSDLEQIFVDIKDDIGQKGLVQDMSDSLDSAINSAKVMKNIVDQLKEVSEHEDYQMTSENIESVIDETLRYLDPSIGEKIKSLKISRDYEKDVPQVKLNRYKIMQALTAQIMNSLDAIAAKRYSDNEEPTLYFRVQCNDKSVNVTTGDNGIGIEKKDQSEIFTPFFSKKGPGQQKGTGLGLTQVSAIINKHHGTYKVVSEPLKYTEITWSIPI